MQDIHVPIRALYYDVITSKGYTCYENGAVPDDAVMPYVIIADVTATEASDKTCFGNQVQVLLDIVTGFPKAQVAGSMQADIIAGNILSSINSKTKLELSGTLQLVNTKKIQDQKIAMQSNTHRIYRRLIRYQQLIKEG